MLAVQTLPLVVLPLPNPAVRLLPAPPPTLCLPDPARTAFEARLVDLLTPIGGSPWPANTSGDWCIGRREQYWTVVISRGDVHIIDPRRRTETFRLTLTPHALRVILTRCQRRVMRAELARLRRDLSAQLFAQRDRGPLKMLTEYDGATIHVDDPTMRCLVSVTGVSGIVRAQEYVPNSLLHRRGPSWCIDYNVHFGGRDFVHQVLRPLVESAVATHNALLPALAAVAPVSDFAYA